MDALQIVRDAFPISGGRGQLQLAGSEGEPAEPERLTVRLVVWDEHAGELFAEVLLASKQRFGRWLRP